MTVTDANDSPALPYQGHLQIVTANYYSNNVGVLLGDGAGNFTTTTVGLPGGAQPASAALGDVNGDGKTDIVTANFGSNNVSLLLGDGLGGFTATTLGIGQRRQRSGCRCTRRREWRRQARHRDAAQLGGNVSVLLGDGTGGSPPASSRAEARLRSHSRSEISTAMVTSTS